MRLMSRRPRNDLGCTLEARRMMSKSETGSLRQKERLRKVKMG